MTTVNLTPFFLFFSAFSSLKIIYANCGVWHSISRPLNLYSCLPEGVDHGLERDERDVFVVAEYLVRIPLLDPALKVLVVLASHHQISLHVGS